MEYRKFGDTYIVRMDRDEEILAQLKIFAEKEQVKLASVTALGAVKDFTIGVFDTSAKAYHSNRFQGVYEIVLAIFEGIHALNDVIVGKNPKAFKLYIAARSNVVDEDGAVVFQHPWLRLCRRIVRDYKFRGSDANFTLKMWPNVRRGEKLYISPYKENADLMFDSSLPDEVAVLKPFVVPLLEALPQGKYEIADDILRGFERIEIMEESNIAPSSLVREFIGGSIYPS